MCDPCLENRGLPHTARPVQDRQSRGQHVRSDDLAFALAPEEEQGVELGVLERNEPLVRAPERSADHVATSSQPTFEVRHEVMERNVVEVHAPLTPEFALDRMSTGKHRPRAIADRLVAECAVQKDPEAPLHDRIGDEQQMAPPQLRSERDRNDVRQLGLREVADVVVFADDEALTIAIRARVDLAVDLENHGTLLEGELGVGVGNRDDRLRSRRAHDGRTCHDRGRLRRTRQCQQPPPHPRMRARVRVRSPS